MQERAYSASVTGQALEVDSEQLKRFNRAVNFFGDPCKRLNDSLILEKPDAYIENYRRGSMALVLHCHLPVIEFFEPKGAGFIHVDRPNGDDRSVFLVLKANTVEDHRLQRWNEKLMFVDDVQIVKSPEQWIPSLVGLYRFDDEFPQSVRNLLLFQSTIQPLRNKFLPRIADWKPRPFASTFGRYELVVENIEGAPKIVQHITCNNGGIACESGSVNREPQMICSLPQIVINGNGVEIRVPEGSDHKVQVEDVLVGPFNLFV